MLLRSRSAATLLLLAACAPAATRPAAEIRDPESLVYAIHERYGTGNWYGSVVADQRVTLHRGDSTVVEHWTTYATPGRLRVETDAQRANGLLRVRDSVFVIRDGRVTAQWEEPNLVVAFVLDLFWNHPLDTLDQLADYGFLPGTLRRDTWEGEPAYVVSAARDGRTRELWVEARRLLPVRVVEPLPGGRTREIRFENYQPRRRAWLAERVEIREDGRLVQLAEYDNVVTGLSVWRGAFEPGRWRERWRVNGFSRGYNIDASDMGHPVSYH